MHLAFKDLYAASNREHGFTLIELSIVLVIIGLLIGSVLVGQDLIDAARVHSQIEQIEKYQVAVTVFQGKYGCLPGDCQAAKAAQLGLASRAGGTGRGDGDGMLCTGFCPAAGSSKVGGETALFWRDLADTNLIAGPYVGTDCTSWNCVASSASVPVSTLVSTAAIGNGNYIAVYGDPAQGVNLFQIIALGSIDADGEFVDFAAGLSHAQAFAIDTKLDDSLPLTGSVRARLPDLNYSRTPSNWNPAWSAAAAGNCGNSSTTPLSYNVGRPNASDMIYGPCSLTFRFP